MPLLRGASSFCQQGTIAKACKAFRRSVEDTLCHAFAVMVAMMRVLPSFSTIQPFEEALGVSPSSNFHSRARVPPEEELAMIDLGVLPPSCKDLTSTLVHLTPPKFYKGL